MRKMSNYENFIAVSRYARWREADMRRETWTECVDRYISFFKEHLEQYGVQKNDEIFTTVRTAILNRDVMPSMRALMSAGEPLRRNHMASYNCSFIVIDNTRCFDEIMFILMSGTGVGFSVERKSVEQRVGELMRFLPKSFDTSKSPELCKDCAAQAACGPMMSRAEEKILRGMRKRT